MLKMLLHLYLSTDPHQPVPLGETVGFAPGARDQRVFESHGEDVATFTTVTSAPHASMLARRSFCKIPY